ncbi:MAG TPA: hypothetical protein VM012_06020 [Flavitalea sp.]|nr:hypothetical protein [Flavitalea sp.]
MRSIIILSVVFLSVQISCSKKDDLSEKESFLTLKPWKFSKSETRTNNDPWVDEAVFWPVCEKDNEIVFKKNHSYEINEGATKCDPLDEQMIDAGRWSLSSGDTKLVIDGEEVIIEILDAQQLVFYSVQTLGTDTFTEKFTLVH